MNVVEQRDVFGENEVQHETEGAPAKGLALYVDPEKVFGGSAHRWMTLDNQSRAKLLKLVGVPVPDDPSRYLAAWRDAMAERTGTSVSGFRRWVDYEVNLYGNTTLARFIWAIA